MAVTAHFTVTTLTILALSLSACVEKTTLSPQTAFSMSTSKTSALATQHQKYLLIDVRTADEYDTNGLKQAVNIPYETIGNKIDALTKGDKTTPIKVYCRSGRRADIALAKLQSLGYQNVENLETVDNATDYIQANPIH